MLKNLKKKYRYSLILLRELVITEFKIRYQGSVLGYLWSVMRPLFLFVIMYFVFVFFLKIGDDVPHWPVQLLLGIVLWNFFAEVTNNGVTSIVNRGDVIRKINFPKYVIVLSSSISALINLIINLVVIAIFMMINHVDLQWSVLIAPFYILELFLLGIGIAFILSTWFVKIRDINYIWEVIMQGLFYASIVIYPITKLLDYSHKITELALLNPVAQSIQSTRHALVTHSADTLYSLSHNFWLSLLPILITVTILLLGMYIFKKNSPLFAENV